MRNQKTVQAFTLDHAWLGLMLSIRASWLRALNAPDASDDELRNHLACFQRVERLAGFKFPGRVV